MQEFYKERPLVSFIAATLQALVGFETSLSNYGGVITMLTLMTLTTDIIKELDRSTVRLSSVPYLKVNTIRIDYTIKLIMKCIYYNMGSLSHYRLSHRYPRGLKLRYNIALIT